MGPIGARRGSSGTRMGPYLSRTPIRVHRVIRQGPSRHVGHIGQSSVRSKTIKFGPKWVENRPFGPKQRPNEPKRLSGPIRTTPEAKNDQKSNFSKKTPLGGPRQPPPLLLAQAGAYVFHRITTEMVMVTSYLTALHNIRWRMHRPPGLRQ